MDKFLSAALTAVFLPLAALVPAEGASPAGPPHHVCDNTASTPLTGDHSRVHVVVEEGASCYLEDAVIHSLRADHPADVFILGTDLAHRARHNVMITGATGDVVIGSERCGFDPSVGNNIKVRDSNNVLICDMAVDNNISVTGSHGRVTVRDSTACNNVTVSRSDAYDGVDTTHRRPEAIRLIDLRAGVHIRAEGNSGRPVVLRDTNERFMRPSGCRRTLGDG